jgi:hypothetical protein
MPRLNGTWSIVFEGHVWSQHKSTRPCVKHRDANLSDPERRLYGSSRSSLFPPEAGRQSVSGQAFTRGRAPLDWTNDAGNTAAARPKVDRGGCLTRLCARQRQPDLNVLAVLAPDRILPLLFHYSCIPPTIHCTSIPRYLSQSLAVLIPSCLHSQLRYP